LKVSNSPLFIPPLYQVKEGTREKGFIKLPFSFFNFHSPLLISPSLIQLERGKDWKKDVLVSPFSFSKEKGWG
jgi:hypothetical protein